MVQECATEHYATSAKARAIDCSSTEIKSRCDEKDRRSDGKASVRRSTDGKQRGKRLLGQALAAKGKFLAAKDKNRRTKFRTSARCVGTA